MPVDHRYLEQTWEGKRRAANVQSGIALGNCYTVVHARARHAWTCSTTNAIWLRPCRLARRGGDASPMEVCTDRIRT